MNPRYLSWLPLALALSCGGTGTPAALDTGGGDRTGLDGMVRRGPIQPVCRMGVSCDAPFSAAFEVRQTQQVVARFRSDSAGHFLVYLAPGRYTVVPDTSAHLLGAIWQTRDVTVGPNGLTHVELAFDTGIR